MPDYTRAQLLLAVRKDHPEFSSFDDETLFRAVATDHPDLAKGAKEYQSAPANAPDDRSTGQVAWDQTKAVGRGIGNFITGLPGAMYETAKTGYDLASGNPAAQIEAAKRALAMVKGTAEQIAAPVTPIVQTAGNLIAPNSYPPATRQSWEQGAEAAGSNFSNLATMRAGQSATTDNLKALAEKARQVRANAPGVVDSLAATDLTHPLSVLKTAPAAIHGVAGAAAGAAAPMLDLAARAKMAMGDSGTPAYGGAVASEDPFQAGVDQSRQALANRPLQAPPPAPVEQAVPLEVQKVRDSLIRRGKGAASADLATTNAQYLLKIMPEAAGLSDVPDASGVAPFDRALTDKLNATGHEINAKLQQDVPGKKVDTTDASLNMDEIANKASGYGDHTTANKIRKLAAALDQSGMTDAQIVTQIRQSLMDSSLDISSGLGNEVYKIFKDLSEKISPGIKDLNQKYFTLKTAAEIGKIRTGGLTPESQVGAGTRPGADFRDSQKARVDAAKKARAK